MDIVSVTGIEFITRIGTTKRERAKPQKLNIDISLMHTRTDFSDDITTTFDYFPLVNEILKLADTERNLIETLGRDILDLCLADARIESATVTVHKPEALKNGVPSVILTKTQ